MKITKAIIPAAGLGTHFLPATKSQPKEMLPIVDKPCIHYLVDEAVKSGITEIIIVTGRGKRAIEDYFDHSFELAEHLKKHGKLKELKEIQEIEKIAKIAYVRQPYPQGDGHAILCAKEFVKGEPFAVLFGDDLYDSKKPALAQMIEEYERYQSPIIALTKIDKKDSNKYGMVKAKNSKNNLYEIQDLIEKPAPAKAPSNLAITGKYIITPELLEQLEKTKPTSADKELRLIDGMRAFIKNHPIYGCEIDGHRFDTGDKLGYLQAVIHYALKHKDLHKDFKKYLQGLDLK